ncbi:MAG: hypothetical protein IJM80_04940 [Firmicutes bacterium]|nr:hypothetical protein [Bacillota bacterium]
MHRFSVAKAGLIRRLLALLLAAALVLGCAAFAFAGDAPAAGSDGAQQSEEPAEGTSQQDRERKVELYTIGAMVTLGAIVVGLREKRNRR